MRASLAFVARGCGVRLVLMDPTLGSCFYPTSSVRCEEQKDPLPPGELAPGFGETYSSFNEQAPHECHSDPSLCRCIAQRGWPKITVELPIMERAGITGQVGHGNEVQ